MAYHLAYQVNIIMDTQDAYVMSKYFDENQTYCEVTQKWGYVKVKRKKWNLKKLRGCEKKTFKQQYYNYYY